MTDNHILQIAHPDMPDDWGELMQSYMYKFTPEEVELYEGFFMKQINNLTKENNRLKEENADLKRQLFGHNHSINKSNY